MLVSIAFVFGRLHYRVGIELQPARVVAGERALGRLVVENAGAATSTPSRLELPVGAGLAEFVVPALAPGAEHEELFAVPTNRRAVIVAGPAVSVRGDQLGLLRRTVRWTEPVELFVHPRTARLQPSAAGLVRDLEGEVTKTITNNDISFHALRAVRARRRAAERALAHLGAHGPAHGAAVRGDPAVAARPRCRPPSASTTRPTTSSSSACPCSPPSASR